MIRISISLFLFPILQKMLLTLLYEKLLPLRICWYSSSNLTFSPAFFPASKVNVSICLASSMLPGKPTSALEYLVLSYRSIAVSSSLWEAWGWFTYLGHCHPCAKTRIELPLLASAWISSSCHGQLGVNLRMGDASVSAYVPVSSSLCVWVCESLSNE